MNVEKISEITIKVNEMARSVHFYNRFWAHLKEKEFSPAGPRDAAWGERYFHLHDPDGHELSFAQPIR